MSPQGAVGRTQRLLQELEGTWPGAHTEGCRRAAPAPEPPGLGGQTVKYFFPLDKSPSPKRKVRGRGGDVAFIFNKMALAVCEAALCQL